MESLKKNIDVSIIIINYNTFQLTCNCINSIIQNTFDINYEIILLDNASTEIIQQEFECLFPNIILIKSTENLGFSKGSNFAIKHANGKYILLLNSDTILKDNAIKIAHNYLEQQTKAGAMTIRIIFPDGTHQAVCQRFPSIRYQVFELFRLHKLISKKKSGKILLGAFFNHKERLVVDWVWGTFFIFRAKILTELKDHKLNDNFFMYCEDMQWCWDFKKLGYEVHFCPDAEIIHYMGSSEGNKKQYMRNNYNLFIKSNFLTIHAFTIKILRFLLNL